MIGRFIAGTVQAQDQCRQSPEYSFEEHPPINNLVLTECTMDLEASAIIGYHSVNLLTFLDFQMRDARMFANDPDSEHGVNVSISQHGTREQYSKDTAILRKRKIIFWAS